MKDEPWFEREYVGNGLMYSSGSFIAEDGKYWFPYGGCRCRWYMGTIYDIDRYTEEEIKGWYASLHI